MVYEELEEFVLQDEIEEYADDYDRGFDEHRDEYLSEFAVFARSCFADPCKTVCASFDSPHFSLIMLNKGYAFHNQ